MINLDNASTTKPFNEVVNAISIALQEDYLNMGAKYKQAKIIAKKTEVIKDNFKKMLGASEGEIIFTPSATIANNLVFASINPKTKKRVLISAGEHSSVYECAKHLQNLGVQVDFVPLCKNGCANYEAFKSLMDESVGLVSIMHVNNETGAINDIAKFSSYAKSINKDCLVHSDGVQAFGKIEVNLDNLGVDFYTISAHKIHGPKGIGALFVKDLNKLKTIIYGGGQEHNLISGTENFAYMSGFHTAAKLKLSNLKIDYEKVLKDKLDFISALENHGINYIINGDLENSSPYILNLSIAKIKGEILLHALAEKNILIATGSACSSKKRGNRVLESLGKTNSEVDSAIRISFSAYEKYDMDFIAKTFKEVINNLV